MQIAELKRINDPIMWVEVPADLRDGGINIFTIGRELRKGNNMFFNSEMGSIVLWAEDGQRIVAFTNQEGNIEIYDILPRDESRSFLAEQTKLFAGQD